MLWSRCSHRAPYKNRGDRLRDVLAFHTLRPSTHSYIPPDLLCSISATLTYHD